MKDSQPEIYWSQEEKNFGDLIIYDHCKEEFGSLLISDRFGTQFGKYHEESYNKDKNVITKLLKENPLPYFYWTGKYSKYSL